MSGFISPKREVKSRMDSRIFSGSNRGNLSLVGMSFCSALITTRSTYKFYSQKRKMAEPIEVAQPSLFFPYFDFTLMNVYMNTGIK